jgi:hypothetical protein
MMDEVQKPSNSECYTLLSESFRFNILKYKIEYVVFLLIPSISMILTQGQKINMMSNEEMKGEPMTIIGLQS